MFDPNRPRKWNPSSEMAEANAEAKAYLDAAAITQARTENNQLRDQLRVVRAENEQLHQMLAAQAETITAVQRLVGAPAPATINAVIDVRLEVDKQLTPATKKEIEAFVERLQRIGDGSGPVDS